MTNLDFDEAFSEILKTEGGFVNLSTDKGGPTNLGITISTLSSFLGRKATIQDVQNLTTETAKIIYKKHYWDSMNLDLLNNKLLKLMLFDQGVNRGCKTAIKAIQKVIGVDSDGIMGVATIGVLNKDDGLKYCFNFLKSIQTFYVNLAKKDSSQMIFLSGWINRSHKLLTLIQNHVVLKNET